MSRSNEIAEKRFGRIFCTMAFLDCVEQSALDELKKKIFVIRTDHDCITNSIEMTCSSLDFDPVPEGCKIPVYDAQFIEITPEDSSDRCFQVRFEKVD